MSNKNVFNLLYDKYGDLVAGKEVIEVKYSGVITGADYYVESAGQEHPLYSKDSTVKFEKLLACEKPVSLTGQNSGDSSLVHHTQSTSSITTVGALNSCGWDHLEQRLVESAGITGYGKASTIEFKHRADGQVEVVLNNQATVNFRFVKSFVRPATTGNYPSILCNYHYPYLLNCSATVKDGGTNIAANGWHMFPPLGVPGLEVADKSKGVYFQRTSGNTIKAPRISGYRSVGIMLSGLFTNGSTTAGSYTIIWGFVPGEDSAEVYVDGAVVGFYDAGDYRNMLTIDNVRRRFDVTYDNVVYNDEGISNKKYWPLSRSGLLCGSVVGRIMSDVTTDEQVAEGKIIKRRTLEMNVARLSGVVSKADFLDLVGSGLGVLTPPSAERQKEISKSWERVPSTIYYVVQPYTFENKLTWVETEPYKQRQKLRARACKTNDFFDLQFNQDYTYGQVETMLSKVKTLNVAVYCEYGVKTYNSTGNVGTVTFVVSGAVVNANHSGGTSLTALPKTAESLQLVMDKYPGAYLAGDLSWIGDATTVEMGEWNSDRPNARLSDVRLSSVSYFTVDPLAELVKKLSQSELVSFISHQVTDFRNFNSSWANLTISISGENILRPFLLLT